MHCARVLRHPCIHFATIGIQHTPYPTPDAKNTRNEYHPMTSVSSSITRSRNSAHRQSQWSVKRSMASVPMNNREQWCVLYNLSNCSVTTSISHTEPTDDTPHCLFSLISSCSLMRSCFLSHKSDSPKQNSTSLFERIDLKSLT